MKKLLFTLCAVLAGFAASAENTLVFQYVDADGKPLQNNEIIMKPGTEATVHMQVTEIPDVCVQGFSWNLFAKNQAGEKTGITGDVQLKNLGTALSKKYYLGEDLATIDGATIGSSTPNTDDGIPYRIIATNTSLGLVFGNAAGIGAKLGLTAAEVEGALNPEQYTIPGNVFYFTITTSADWDEEYATLDLNVADSKISWGDNTSSYFADMDIKVINENKIPTLEDLTGTVTFTVDEATGKVSVNYSGNEDVTIKVMLGDDEVTMPYQLTDGAEPITLTYEVTAEGYNPLTGSSDPLSWTAPVAPEAPSISIVEAEDYLTMTVTVTAAEGCTLIVNGEAQNSNTYTYTVERTTDIYTADAAVAVTAKAVKGDLESTEASDSKAWTVVAKPNATTPVITFAETKDGEVVTAVTVQIANWTKATINGEEFTNTRDDVKTFTANYTADQEITVVAENDPGYPYVKATAEDTYTLKKLDKKAVPAPEVTPTTGDDAVTLNITWPESDGTHVIKVNGEESTETSFPRQDADYTVTLDIYVTEGPTCAESTHYTQTITIPKKVTTPTEQTGSPVFVNSPYTKPNENAYFAQLENSESGATIYYQVTDPDGNTTGWLEYTPGQEIACYGANGGGKDGNYTIEAYAQAPGKDPSKHISLSFQVGPTTGIDELIDGKAIANVRYFNMAGQEMQEANGITIVVTTYTDGTSSAVKVMK